MLEVEGYKFYRKEITGSYFGTNKNKDVLVNIPLNRDNTIDIDILIVETLEGINKETLTEINNALDTSFTMEEFN